MLDQLYLSPQLFILGFGASSALEFLRGLILKIEDHPRLERTWKYYPAILGMILINFFPSIVPVKDLLILWAHGAISPTFAYLAYPLLKKAFVAKMESPSLLTSKEKTTKEATVDSTPEKSEPTPKEG